MATILIPALYYDYLHHLPFTWGQVDNNLPYAIFANVGNTYFAEDHPNYDNGTQGFPNGTYTLTVDLHALDGVGKPQSRIKFHAYESF